MGKPHLASAVLALCTSGLLACGQAAPPERTTVKEDGFTLKMNKLHNGNLEYCDADSGECRELPYEGECAAVEIEVDPATGATCERCILASGEIIDHGCVDVSVGCVLVTIPDPDCVVCAYVNGAVIFSTCVVEEPQCHGDWECVSDDGRPGHCVDGQCVYEPGCVNNADCPPGFECVHPGADPDGVPSYGVCMPANSGCHGDDDCPEGSSCLVECWDCFPHDPDCHPGCHGVCLPVEPECHSDDDCVDPAGTQGRCIDGRCHFEPLRCNATSDCPEGMMCLFPCDDCSGTNPDCKPSCAGICVPKPPTCEDVICPTGHHCEMLDVVCVAWPCPPLPVCVPDEIKCLSNDDCPPDQECVFDHSDAVDPTCPPPPYGVCRPKEPSCDEVTCPLGQHCELHDICNGPLPCPPYPICVADRCLSQEDCPDGFDCVFPGCSGGSCDPGVTPPEPGVCLPAPQCHSNKDCFTSTGEHGLCIEGICVYEFDCDPRHAMCDMVPPACPPGLVHSIIGHCYGPCVNPSACLPMVCGDDGTCPDPFKCEPRLCDADGNCKPGMCAYPDDNPCLRTGCTRELCAPEPVVSTCEWQPEYACYPVAACEPQDDGQCDWSITPEFEQCIAELP